MDSLPSHLRVRDGHPGGEAPGGFHLRPGKVYPVVPDGTKGGSGIDASWARRLLEEKVCVPAPDPDAKPAPAPAKKAETDAK